jgi:hypothetical protein
MALSMTPRTGPRVTTRQVVEPQRFVPPTSRELRSRSVHRLQVGLLGLCVMLLIVGLANIVMNRAKLANLQNASPSAMSSFGAAQKPADPLADIGVVPAADPSAAAGATKAP